MKKIIEEGATARMRTDNDTITSVLVEGDVVIGTTAQQGDIIPTEGQLANEVNTNQEGEYVAFRREDVGKAPRRKAVALLDANGDTRLRVAWAKKVCAAAGVAFTIVRNAEGKPTGFKLVPEKRVMILELPHWTDLETSRRTGEEADKWNGVCNGKIVD